MHLPARRRARTATRRAALAVALLGLASMGGCMSVSDETYKDLVPTAYAEAKARPPGSILVRIFKEESELEVWKLGADGRYAPHKTHPLCRWSGKLGPKKTNGDRQAPEGFYRVTRALMNPNSKYHRSFNLGYPNPLEKSLGYTGDSLMVHGACSSSGCFAMTDEGVGEVYADAERAFALGQGDFQVQSFPFRMTAEQMARHRSDPNIAFWRNLKLGYDIFEVTRREPEVAACGGRYVFDARRKDRQPIDPAASCPPLETRVAPEVAAKRERDDRLLQSLLSEGRAGMPMSYVDGGMHPRYRDMLKRLGTKGLSVETSMDAVPVSRPEALAEDPADAER
ncbi:MULTISPECIES: L,D-transpeptidase family protein [Aureimonas]|uniref:Murein L,D-transpeptidase YafK n=2 Tax=Aureimonas TaxID=414371 RepID=A0A1H0HE44_9HYPH|nr:MULTISPECIES: murein L,D-transpeptidase family protein [Aureimonas]MBB3934655.1 murein L,D-transpeptidase YafK [Aureimonas phyllosphaerae]MBB3950534.1 murein L,D-transpeptidase YafK [Aureimonas jatrophae]MBB3958129.1 murein L,D-transpeptidase YafK [Aureimonas phyllosphaerae]SDO17121.1 Murein L,D-transpeptidase YafK [Aureimonas jatrophae]SFE92275.1 Murein L,D-transpeptidase YafK [Aureimonas phyllosphaerae]